MTALRRIPIILALLVLAACGGGSGGARDGAEPVTEQCDATSVSEDGVCRTFAERLVTQALTPFVEDGEAVYLEVVLYRPLSPGRYPTGFFQNRITRVSCSCEAGGASNHGRVHRAA